jgi:hypothetical protein
VRWQEREAASAFPQAIVKALPGAPPEAIQDSEAGQASDAEPSPEDAADLAGWRSVWDAPEVEFSPALEFLFPRAKPVLPLSYSGAEQTYAAATTTTEERT